MATACTVDKQSHTVYDVRMQAIFHADSLKADSTYATYAAWDSITVKGMGKDSVLYNNAKSVTTLQLPLRPDTTVTAFLLTYHDRTDTLFIQHIDTIKYISLAAGDVVFFCIEKAWATGCWIDSIALLNPNVQTDLKDNICLIAHEP